ncbi:hypothetical protein BD779DRAFT_716304 [Infundibulicybe gibba]|nr:hypothetical protein BD779DRAFT_716304 [Infundibulicybe gibba]
MSSSATSTAETDSSSLSRGEKRPHTPSDSPQPKKSRHSLDQSNNNWELDSASSQPASGPEDKAHSESGLDQSKVQLPSIFTTFEDTFRDGRRASLPTLSSESRVRHSPYPPTALRQSYNQSSLATYTFPPTNEESANDKNSGRPRLYTDINFDLAGGYPTSGLSNGTTPSSSTFSSSTFTSPMSSDYHRSAGLSPYSEHDNWGPAGIPRPSSTPGQLSNPAVKYEDGLRHGSFSAPLSQAQMFGGSARISGQHDRRSLSAGIKSEWSFPNHDLVLPPGNSYPSPPMPSAPPSASVAVNSPSRSPQSMPSSTLVDRPQRKRGKLPKETTDYLKSWLHRHSDHPYPSEEEKKQLCHATGLSMSQVSNWMINARRRILAPAHRAASGPTTTAPFPPPGRGLSGLLDPTGRRSSMPTADSLQLYHPMTLQSMPNTPHHHHNSADYPTPAICWVCPPPAISAPVVLNFPTDGRWGYTCLGRALIPREPFPPRPTSCPRTSHSLHRHHCRVTRFLHTAPIIPDNKRNKICTLHLIRARGFRANPRRRLSSITLTMVIRTLAQPQDQGTRHRSNSPSPSCFFSFIWWWQQPWTFSISLIYPAHLNGHEVLDKW